MSFIKTKSIKVLSNGSVLFAKNSVIMLKTMLFLEKDLKNPTYNKNLFFKQTSKYKKIFHK